MTSYMVADDIRSWGGTVKAQHFVSRPSWREQLPELLARKEGRSVLGIEVKSGRAPTVFAGLGAFSTAFKPSRTLIVGGDGIPLGEFLTHPVEHWLRA